MRSLPLLGLLLAGCAPDPVGSAVSAIGGGEPSSNEAIVFTFASGVTCSGAVIGPRHVLSAKVCVYAGGTLAGRTQVALGDSVVPPERMLTVDEIVEAEPGPPPRVPGDENDLVVLVTAEDVGVTPLSIAGASPTVGDALTLVGYGQDETGGSGRRREAVAIVAGVDGSLVTTETGPGLCTGDGPALDASGALVAFGLYVFAGGGGMGPACGDSGSVLRVVVPYGDFIDSVLAGERPDAGPPPDAGERDAGGAGDAGPIPDAGAAAPDAGPGEGSSSGCGCRVAGREPGPSGWLLAFAALLAARRRRR